MASEKTKKPSEMNPEDLPNVRAFQDEFTRGFLQSTKEIRPGYYPFLSGTGKYEMDFPEGGIIGERAYSLKKDQFESYLIGIQSSLFESSINITYTEEKEGNEQITLDMLRRSTNEDLKFKKEELQNTRLYTAPLNEYGDIGFVSYIQNLNGIGGIQLTYVSECVKENEKCSKNIEKQKLVILDWIKSIHFIKKENESE